MNKFKTSPNLHKYIFLLEPAVLWGSNGKTNLQTFYTWYTIKAIHKILSSEDNKHKKTNIPEKSLNIISCWCYKQLKMVKKERIMEI